MNVTRWRTLSLLTLHATFGFIFDTLITSHHFENLAILISVNFADS